MIAEDPISPWLVLLLWLAGRLWHETAHAIAIWGLMSARLRQQYAVRPNPFRYASIWQNFVAPGCCVFLWGLPLPGNMVALNQRYLPQRWQQTVVALSGPIATFLLILLIRQIAMMVSHPVLMPWLQLEVIGFTLNLLPLPGMDLYGVIAPWLPKGIQSRLAGLKRYSIYVLVIGTIWWFINANVRPPNLGFNLDIQRLAASVFCLTILIRWGIARSGDEAEAATEDPAEPLPDARSRSRLETDLAIIERQIADRPSQAAVGLWMQRGRMLQRLERWDAALTNYDEAVEYHPRAAKLWQERGVVLAEQKQFESALASFVRATHDGQPTIEDWHYQADMLLELAHYEVAIAAFDQILARSPKDAHILTDRGYAFYQLKRYDEANASIDRALEIEPNSSYAVYRKTQLLQQKGEYQTACQVAAAHLNRNPDDNQMWTGLMLLLHDGPLEEWTLAFYNLHRSHNPDNFTLFDKHISLLLRLKHADAVRNLLMAVEVDRLSINQLRLRCRLHYQSQDYALAMADCQLALASEPENPVGLELQGQILTGLGQYEAAIAVYETLLEKHPDYYWVRVHVGQLLGQLGRHKAELAAYETVLAARSADVDVLYLQALTLIELGRSNAAQTVLVSIIAIAPEHELAKMSLAELPP
jgi:tetratricopeptide (TPR) repeat protein